MEMRTIDLRTAAIAEASRIAAARSLLRRGDEAAREWLSTRRPWMAASRSGRRRSTLRGGSLLMWQVAAEDSCGSVVAASIVPMIVQFAAATEARSPRIVATELVSRLESCPPQPIADVLRERTARMVAVARAFADARLVRERAAAARCSSLPPPTRFQPGLFDRRAERARRLVIAADTEDVGTAAARIAAAAGGAAVTAARPMLLLVLTA